MYNNNPQQFYNQQPANNGWGQAPQQPNNGWGQPAQQPYSGWGQQPQAPGLPFDPTRPQFQTTQITVNNCPVNLSVLQNQVHPNLLSYLVPIAVACIDALQSRAGQNPLRMFLFNQMAVNSYNNQNFLQLVKSVCDLAECNAAQGVQIENAITGAVDMSIQFYAFSNLQTFPGLQQFVDPSTHSNLQALQQKQAQVSQLVMQYQQQKAMRQQQQGAGGYGGYSNQGFQTNTFNQQQSLQAANTPQSWHTQSTGMFSAPVQAPVPQEQPTGNMVEGWAAAAAAQQTFNQNNQGFNQTPQQPVQQRPEACPPFSFNTPSAPQQQAPVQPTVGGLDLSQYEKFYQHPGGKVMVKYGDPGVKFKLSNNWPHTPRPNRSCDVYYVLHEDGSMEPIIKKLNKEEQMEKAKHYAATHVRTAHEKIWSILDFNKEERMEEIQRQFEAGELIVRSDMDFKKPAVKEDEVVKDESYVAVTSAEDVWSQADISLTLTDTEDTKCVAYIKPALHVTPIVAKCDVKELVDSVKGSVTLEQCANKLKAESYSIRSLTDAAQMRQRQTIYGKVNRMLTASVNHYLKYKLALPGLKIDSFEEDAGELLEYLKTEYPEAFSTALASHQRSIIRSVLSTTIDDFDGSEFDESLRDQHLAGGDIKNNQPLFLYRKEFYMSVNMFSLELGHEGLDDEEPSSVFKDGSPLLYSLCEQMSASAKKLEEADDDVYSYYIKTLDDHVYVVNRSALNPSTYIIGRK
jgi:hypothetical protein